MCAFQLALSIVLTFPLSICRYILHARELPILSMIEKIKTQIMTRVYMKQKEVEEKWSGNICPKIKQKLEKNAELANTCYTLPAGKGIFQVTYRDHQFIVDINVKCCDCRRWQLTGIPCSHAISCFRNERIQPEDMVSPCYSLESFCAAYKYNIVTSRDQSKWEKMNGVNV